MQEIDTGLIGALLRPFYRVTKLAELMGLCAFFGKVSVEESFFWFYAILILNE
jgi:hypothetical protein